MSERPFWNARDVGLLVVALSALGALPAATRAAPMSWEDVLDAPQWWSNTRLMGDPTCMSPLYERDASIREHMFEPSCHYGWGARGRDDYMIERVRYRFEQAAVLELAPMGEVEFEPEALTRFGLPVGPPARRTLRIDDVGREIRTLSWWDVEARGHRLDRVDLIETATPSGSPHVRARLYVNRYAYDTTHLRDEVDHPSLGLALPEAKAGASRDRPHAWLSARAVGVREGYDATGDESEWESMRLDAPELADALTPHIERHETAQHGQGHLLVYASRSLPMSRVRAFFERARELGFWSASLMAAHEEEGGTGRRGAWLGKAAPSIQIKFTALEPLHTFEIGMEGFTVSRYTLMGRQRMLPIPGCPPQGPTVCLKPGTWDPRSSFARAARHDDAGRLDEGHAALDAGLSRYDYTSLYVIAQSLAMDIIRSGAVVTVEAGDDVPVALLLRTLSVLKYARGPRPPVGSDAPVPCVLQPSDDEELWSLIPCDQKVRDISIHMAVP